ncbi:hypothetical protein BUGL105410_37620 [Burkholderia gladioli]
MGGAGRRGGPYAAASRGRQFVRLRRGECARGAGGVCRAGGAGSPAGRPGAGGAVGAHGSGADRTRGATAGVAGAQSGGGSVCAGLHAASGSRRDGRAPGLGGRFAGRTARAARRVHEGRPARQWRARAGQAQQGCARRPERRRRHGRAAPELAAEGQVHASSRRVGEGYRGEVGPALSGPTSVSSASAGLSVRSRAALGGAGAGDDDRHGTGARRGATASAAACQYLEPGDAAFHIAVRRQRAVPRGSRGARTARAAGRRLSGDGTCRAAALGRLPRLGSCPVESGGLVAALRGRAGHAAGGAYQLAGRGRRARELRDP